MKVLLKQGVGNQCLDQEEIILDTHTVEQNYARNNSSEDVNASKERGLLSLMHGGNIITKASDSSGSDVVSYNSRSSVSTKELEGNSLYFFVSYI